MPARAFIHLLVLVWASLTLTALAQFDDENNWVNFGADPAFDARVRAMVVDDAGNLYCGGDFSSVDGMEANRVAMWDGSSWSALGDGISGQVNCLAFADGNLYAGGQFTIAGEVSAINVARWNGTEWSSLGIGPNGTVFALAATGDDVYVGGSFTIAGGIGGITVNNIAQWDGSSWNALGTGSNNLVTSIVVNGSSVVAGGRFTSIGGVPTNRIAQWDGSAWTALGSGVNQQVLALAELDGEIYAGGEFSHAGGISVGNIARWDGSAWNALAGGLGTPVYAITASDEGVFVGIGVGVVRNLRHWNRGAWSQLGSGTNRIVRSLAIDGFDLYVGGDFTTAGGKTSTFAGQALTPFESKLVVEDPDGETLESGAGLIFNEVAIGSTDATLTLTVRNEGSGTLEISDVSVTGAGTAYFSVDSTELEAPLLPGESATFDVTFLPTDTTERTITIEITNNDPDSNPYLLTLTGIGASPEDVFEAAMLELGLTGSDAEADATPFGDGVENLLKYAFNMDLSGPDRSILEEDGDSGLPRIELIDIEGSAFLRFEYLQRTGSALVYTPMKSTNLGTFSETTATPTIESIDLEWNRIRIDEPVDLTTSPASFGRVTVDFPPD